MRKNITLFITIMIVGLASCSMPTMSADLMGMYNIPEFNDIQEANIWVNQYVEYVYDSENPDGDLIPTDNWQTPEETLYLSTGDCEDFASLLLWIVEEQGLGEGYLLSMIYEKNGIMMGHITTVIAGRYYQYGLSYDIYPENYKTVKAYTLDEYIKISNGIFRSINY